MIWIVTLVSPKHFPTRLGCFDIFAEAVMMALTHGAVGEPERHNHAALCYPMHGHEDDDNYAVWIERV